MSKRRAETGSESYKEGLFKQRAEENGIKSKLVALNSQFASWIKAQEACAPEKLWLDGARDYIQYAEQILSEYEKAKLDSKPGISIPTSTPAVSTITTSPLFFGAKASESNVSSSLSGEKKTDFFPPPTTAPSPIIKLDFRTSVPTPSSDGAPSLTTSSPPTPLFGSGLPSTSLFNLASAPADASEKSSAPTAALGGFTGSFGAVPSFTVPSFGSGNADFGFVKPLSFMSGPPTTASTGREADNENPEEPVDDCAKSDMKVISSEATTILFSAKAKFYVNKVVKDAERWVDHGMGLLSVRKAKTGDGKPFICFASDSGKALLTTSITKSLKIILKDKNLLFSAPWQPEADKEVKMGKFLFKTTPATGTAFTSEVERVQGEQ